MEKQNNYLEKENNEFIIPNNMRLYEYVKSIDKSSFKKGIISAVIYDYRTNNHLYLFNIDKDEDGIDYCTMLCEPLDTVLAYAELSLPYLDQLDMYYSAYKPLPNDKDIGKSYKTVLRRLKKKEERLLELGSKKDTHS